MKTRRLSVLLMSIAMILLLAACGGKEKGEKKYYGTWKAAQVEIEDSIFTVEELEAVGDDSISDTYIIIKEGGKAYLFDQYNSNLADWTVDEHGIKIEDQIFEYKNRTLTMILDNCKIVFEKVSSNQGFIDLESKSDASEKSTAEDKTSKSDKESSETEKKSEETKPDKKEETRQDKTEETKQDKSEKKEREATAEDIQKKSEKQEENRSDEPVGDFAVIVNNGNAKIESIEAELKTEWETLTASITDYASFVKSEEAVEAFYDKIEDQHVEMCTIAYQSALDYGKAIMASDSDWGEKYDMAGKLENDVYDDMLDSVEDMIYDGLLKDMEDYFYDGVLKDEDEAGVSYGDWYETKSDEYSRWYSCRSNVYSEWYDARSDIYSFKFDLAGELWSKDADGAQKTVDRFEKRVNKRVGG